MQKVDDTDDFEQISTILGSFKGVRETLSSIINLSLWELYKQLRSGFEIHNIHMAKILISKSLNKYNNKAFQ